MKKTFLIAAVLLNSLLISCNSDDENEDTDPLIGEWIRTEFTTNLLIEGNEGPTSVEDHRGCEANNLILIVDEYGTTELGPITNLTTGECYYESGTWENIGYGKYKFTSSSLDAEILTPEFSGKSIKLKSSGSFENDTFIFRATYTKE
jgi:hypothetical protein